MKYNGSSWDPLGQPGFSSVMVHSPSISHNMSFVLDSNDVPYIAYSDSSTSSAATVMKYTGNGDTGWEILGQSGFSVGSVQYISIDIDSNNTPYVTYRDIANSNKVTVMKYSTTTEAWESLGPAGFYGGDIYETFIKIDSRDIPYVSFIDENYDSTVMKYTGNGDTGWETVGQSGFNNFSFFSYFDLSFDDVPYFLTGFFGIIMKYTGNGDTGWETVGQPLFSEGNSMYSSIAIDSNNVPYVAYTYSENSDKVTVMKYYNKAPTITGLSNDNIARKGTTWTWSSDDANALYRYVINQSDTYIFTNEEYSDTTSATQIEGDGTYYIHVQAKDFQGNESGVTSVYSILDPCGQVNWHLLGQPGFSTGQVGGISLVMNSNDIPYIAYSDQTNGFRSTVMKYSTTTNSWEFLGEPGFSSGPVYNDGGKYNISFAIDSDDIPYVAYSDTLDSNKLTVMKYTGNGDTGWETVGQPGFSAGGASGISFAIDSNNIPYVSYQDNANSRKATVMKYIGNGDTGWETVGQPGFSSLSLYKHTSLVLDSDNIPYVALKTKLCEGVCYFHITVMKYTGNGDTGWETVGQPELSSLEPNESYLAFLALDHNNIPYFSHSDSLNSRKITVMKYTGNGDTGWEAVGQAGFSSNRAFYTTIAIDSNNIPYVAYSDEENSYKITVMKYTGNGDTGWEAVGQSGFSAAAADFNPIVMDSSNIPYVAYFDWANGGKATVMRYGDYASPIINILGSNPTSVYRNREYTDSGATAIDNIDGNLTSSIATTNNVNTSNVGTYYVNYFVYDIDFNIARATREVNVINPPGGGLLPSMITNINNNQNQIDDNSNTDDNVDNNQQSNTIDYTNGRFVKEDNNETVYFIDSNNIKHPYPDQNTWESYYDKDFRNVETISKEELNTYSTGPIVSHKEGSLIKTINDTKVYKVYTNKILRWIVSEQVAERLFGNTWNKLIRDISDVFFREYSVGEVIE